MDAVIALTLTLTQPVQGGITGYTWGANSPLACPGYTYDCDTSPAWAAFPLEWYQGGSYKCGDFVQVTVPGEEPFIVRALDSCPGCLHNGVWDTGLPFVCDLPRFCEWGQVPTQTGQVLNLSLWRRRHSRVR